MNRKLAVTIMLAIWGAGPAPAAPQGTPAAAAQGSADARVDFESARREIQGFEAAIYAIIHETFSNPYGLVHRPKGVYLPGYGDMFAFLVNIQRAVIKTPWGEVRGAQEITPAQKKQRMAELTDRLIRLLLERGSSLTQLRPDESVAIVAFFEDRNFPDEENQTRTIVLSALKKDLEEWSHRADRWKEFKQRMKIVEY